MDAEFCIEALEDAMARFGCPEIFNTDQGSQFTAPRFTGVLENAGARVSMDGGGRWMDNVFIERLWRSLKYECIYLHAFETGSELRAGLTADSSEGGHLFQSDRGHHSNLMAASLLSSRGPVSVMSWRRSRGQVVASELGHIRPRFLLDKADWHPSFHWRC